MQKMGINMELVWDRIYDAVIKSIVGVENHIYSGLKKFPNNSNNTIKSNGFDLFGFDIILDEKLK